MLEHQKLIIQKLSTEPGLFKKEVAKSINWLSNNEVVTLYEWLKMKFGSKYGSVIDDLFKKYAA